MNSTITATIFPFLTVSNGKKAIEFYCEAFGAVITEKFDQSDGRISAKLLIGNAEFCVGDEEREFDNLSAESIGNSPVRIILTVSDPDNLYSRAMKSGATQICPVTTEETWRIGKLKDPFGHIWEIGCQIK